MTQSVRRGTNGGVTKAGLLAAAAGGTVIGLAFVVPGFFTTKCPSDVTVKQLLVIPLSALAGVCGSLIDSLLGATLQFSGFCSVRKKVVGKPGPTVKRISGLTVLDNNTVNLVSVKSCTDESLASLQNLVFEQNYFVLPPVNVRKECLTQLHKPCYHSGQLMMLYYLLCRRPL